MSGVQKAQPAIRFKGFSGDWVEKPLGNVADFSKGRGYSKSDLCKSGYPIVLYGRLYTNYQTVITDVDTFVSNDKDSLKSKGNEVVVPASGETSEDIARASVIKQSNIIIGGDLNIINLQTGHESGFTALSISHSKHQSELASKAQGKSVVHIRNSDLKELSLEFPTPTEQTAIGNFFQQLDDSLALHKRKHQQTQQLKKALLGKLFPQKGQTQPEIRLQGFSGDWIRCDFFTVAKVEMCKRVFKEETNNSKGVPFFKIGTFGNKPDSFITEQLFEEYKSLHPYPKKSDILLSASGTIGRAIIYNGEKAYYQDSNIIWLNIDKRKLTNIYLFAFYQTIDWNSYIEGTTIKRLYNSDILSTKIIFPSSIQEQTAIGNFFKQLDDTLALQAEQITTLENLKTAFLQKLFV